MLRTLRKLKTSQHTGRSLDIIACKGWPSADSEVMQWVLTNDPAITLAHPKSVHCFIHAIEHNPAVKLSLQHVHLVAPANEEDRNAMIHALIALFAITRSAYKGITPRLACIHAHGPWSEDETRSLTNLTSFTPHRLRGNLPRDHPLLPVVQRTIPRVCAAHPATPTRCRPTTPEKIRDVLRNMSAHLQLKRRAKHSALAHADEMAMRSQEALAGSAVDSREIRRSLTVALGHLKRTKTCQPKGARPRPRRTVTAPAPWIVATRTASTGPAIEPRRSARPSRHTSTPTRRTPTETAPRRTSLSAYLPIRRGSLSGFFPLLPPRLTFSLPSPATSLVVVDQTMKLGQTLGSRAMTLCMAWPLFVIIISLFLAFRAFMFYGER